MPERFLFPAFLLNTVIFIKVANTIFTDILKESLAEVQQQQIDEFLIEFKGFDPKEAKKKLRILTRHLSETHRHANTELYQNNKDSAYTNRFWKIQEEIKSVNRQLKKYEENKDLVDAFARSHKDYVFHKHGKTV